jgi:hypothetical protein
MRHAVSLRLRLGTTHSTLYEDLQRNQEDARESFEVIWKEVKKRCNRPELGDAGKRCISERGPDAPYKSSWFKLFRGSYF